MINKRSNLFFICLMFVAVGVIGATIHVCRASPDEKKHAFQIEDLSWMAGAWKGTLFNGPIEETWSRPENGVMMGMTRMGSNPAKATYEFLLIEEKNDVPVMFIRHFGQHSKSREEQALEFRLTDVAKNRAVFESDNKKMSFSKVTYSVSGDQYTVKLEGERDGKKQMIEGHLKPASHHD